MYIHNFADDDDQAQNAIVNKSTNDARSKWWNYNRIHFLK